MSKKAKTSATVGYAVEDGMRLLLGIGLIGGLAFFLVKGKSP